MSAKATILSSVGRQKTRGSGMFLCRLRSNVGMFVWAELHSNYGVIEGKGKGISFFNKRVMKNNRE